MGKVHCKQLEPNGILMPQTTHEGLTFEQLASSYSYDKIADRRRVFVRMLLKEVDKRQRPVRVLDIGCGEGISSEKPVNVEYLRAIRAHVDELWGIEPDEQIEPVAGIMDHFQHATIELADLQANSIDIAYSFFVMEHVPNPESFLEAVYRCLKPSGCYLFITPNGAHLFTRLAKTLKKARLDEVVLKVIRSQIIDQYHYPVQYRCNTPKTINAAAKAAGFSSPQYCFFEQKGMTSYFRGPLRPLLWGIQAKRRIYHNPRCLLNLVCRMTKPS